MNQFYNITFTVVKGFTAGKRYGSKHFLKGRTYSVRRKLDIGGDNIIIKNVSVV